VEHIQEVERILHDIEATADPGTRAEVRRLVEGILEFHGAALSRILELSGEPLVRTLARDELVAAMLLLYGLHPEDFATRVQRAVDKLPGVELLQIADFVVRLKGAVPREVIEKALFAAAPEIDAIEIDGPPASPSFVPLEALFSR
jgi:hypothetical protein